LESESVEGRTEVLLAHLDPPQGVAVRAVRFLHLQPHPRDRRRDGLSDERLGRCQNRRRRRRVEGRRRHGQVGHAAGLRGRLLLQGPLLQAGDGALVAPHEGLQLLHLFQEAAQQLVVGPLVALQCRNGFADNGLY
jgi:hypothetical protein